METKSGALDALIQGKIDADTEFQSSLRDLNDSDKADRVAARRKEVAEAEFSSLQEKLKKEGEVSGNYKIRAEKAETDLEKFKPKDPPRNEGNLSTADFYALTTAQVHQDDVEEVQKAAKLLGKSIPETLKEPTVQVLLAKRSEDRKTAAAANIDPTKPASTKPSGKELNDRLSKGEVPKPGSQEAEDLFWERKGGRPSRPK